MQTASVEVVSRGRRFQVLAMESETQTRTIGVIQLQKGGRDDLEIVYTEKSKSGEPLEVCMMRCARRWMASRAK